jgi:hypothetical protein
MDGLVLVVFGVVVVVAIAIAWRSYVLDRRRVDALRGFAASKGWQFWSEDDGLASRWGGEPFGRGEDRKVRNVLSGTDRGRPVVAFDYSYVTESTDSKGHTTRTTHRYAVAVVGLPTFLPTLQVVPEGLLRRAAGALGLGHDIDLESEDFNRRFTVTARDPKFASDVLTPRTMEALLHVPPRAWRIEGSEALCWDDGAGRPVDVLARLALLDGVVAGIPSFVWHDNGVPPDNGPVPPTEGGAS